MIQENYSTFTVCSIRNQPYYLHISETTVYFLVFILLKCVYLHQKDNTLRCK